MLVRSGFDAKMGYDIEGNSLHTRYNVYREMFLNICGMYSCLPDPRSLSLDEVAFFYEGIREQLKENTKKGK